MEIPSLASNQTMKRTGPTNRQTQELIVALQKLGSERNAPLWKRVAQELKKSTRSRREVNLVSLERYTSENDLIIVPGKLLGNGELRHKITIAAFTVSQGAREKLKQSGSTFMDICDLMQKNPDGTGVRLIG